MEMMVVTPDLGVPIPEVIDYPDLLQKAQAACATAKVLEEHGLDLTPTQGDKDTAAALATSYASDPALTDKTVTPAKLATLTPASIVETELILKEYSHAVVKHAVEIRHLVTNKLILETENSNASIRIRALDLLGKFAEVGLFAEKHEVTVTHQSTDDLRKKLREKLDTIMAKDNSVVDVDVKTLTDIDVDAELGLKDG